MADLTATSLRTGETVSVAETTLSGADTLTYSAADRSPVLVLRNPTAGALSVTIDGDAGASVFKPGLGSVDVSAGVTIGPIAAGDVQAVPLHSIKDFLQGTVNVTGGAGLVAALLTF